MAAESTAPKELSVTERPFPVVPFPAQFLHLYGGLNVAPTKPSPASTRAESAEPGQGPSDPQD